MHSNFFVGIINSTKSVIGLKSAGKASTGEGKTEGGIPWELNQVKIKYNAFRKWEQKSEEIDWK